MSRHAYLAKPLAIVLVTLLISIALARIEHLVQERRAWQQQAVASVQESHAGAQTFVGPLLHRVCRETWTVKVEGRGERSDESMRRIVVLQAAPAKLEVDATTRNEARQRGLYKVNGYTAQLTLKARWDELDALVPRREHAGSTLSCGPVQLWAATSDVRGLRSARLVVGEAELPVRSGGLRENLPRGLVADLPAVLPTAEAVATSRPLTAELTVSLVGTAQLALVPAADSVQYRLRADWPHPSFGGRFLPQQRDVTEQGFSASWSVGSLASTAAADAIGAGVLCGPPQHRPAAANEAARRCLDTLAVDYIDPVNPYSLADRAVKYGLLFVGLTFAAVALTEVLSAGRVRRVHPVQYALVGFALALFFLLLLSLSEHLDFGIAYAIAAAACAALLAVYAKHMLGRLRDGLAFGAGIALLYGMLYVLLQREQTALVIGAIGLFVVLAVVMWLTRRVDWYRLGGSATAPPGSPAPARYPA